MMHLDKAQQIMFNSFIIQVGQDSSDQKKKRVIKMFISVVALFFICWAPFHIVEINNDVHEMM